MRVFCERVFCDIDTQEDFMERAGALYVPGAELIRPNLRLLTKCAIENSIPIIGSVDVHFGTEAYRGREKELSRWGGPFPDHCMNGTEGAEKIPETLLISYQDGQGFPPVDSGRYVPHTLDEGVDRPRLGLYLAEICFDAPFRKSPSERMYNKAGLYFEKQSYDVFTNPSFGVFLDMAGIKEVVMYGVATDFCVKVNALGMRRRGIGVYLVRDAVMAVDADTGAEAIEQMKSSGVMLVNTKDVLDGLKI